MNSIRVSLVWIILKESGKSIGTSGDAKGIIKSVIAICTYDSKANNVSFGNFSVSQFKRYENSDRASSCLPTLRKTDDHEPAVRQHVCREQGWHKAAERYETFLRTRSGGKILFLELGVDYNTPVIIKYPFWQMTAKSPDATYACINQGQAVCPREIERQSVCVNADIGQVLQSLSDTAIQ